jgi:hypothetical protein
MHLPHHLAVIQPRRDLADAEIRDDLFVDPAPSPRKPSPLARAQGLEPSAKCRGRFFAVEPRTILREALHDRIE